MHSTLCDAVARCHLRRLRGVAAGAPLPAAIVALVLLTAPVILLRLGECHRAEVAGGIGDARVAEARRARTGAGSRGCRLRARGAAPTRRRSALRLPQARQARWQPLSR